MSELNKIKNLLQYTKTSGKSYSGNSYEGGYHTVVIEGETISGQRNPAERLKNLPYDFTDKVVLDIGSNQGGMLFSIEKEIKEGVGIDFDYRLVNASNRITSNKMIGKINFFVFDLQKEELNLISNFVKSDKIDIIFLLSVAMWIKNWKEVYIWCSINSDNLLFESNGTEEQQEEQLSFLKDLYQESVLISEKSHDDKRIKKRQLYLFKNKRD
jgi:SAM-dependent methyltransferase